MIMIIILIITTTTTTTTTTATTGNMQEAYKYMQQMESKNIALHPFLDGSIIDEGRCSVVVCSVVFMSVYVYRGSEDY